MKRSIVAIVFGFLLYCGVQYTATLLAVMWLWATAHRPSPPSDASSMILLVSCLSVALAATASGYLTAVVTKREELLHALIFGVLLAVTMARFSLFLMGGTPPAVQKQGGFWLVWGLHASVMLGGAALGGYVRGRQQDSMRQA